MRRYPVLILEKALEDLDDIVSFIIERGASEATALNYIKRIRQRCEAIGDAPNGYPLRVELGPDARIVPFEHSATIAYCLAGEAVHVTRVFYGGRDYDGVI